MNADPAAVARTWADELPRDFSRRLAEALRAGPDAVRALKSAAVLPASTAAVHQALQLAESGDGPYASGALTALLDVKASQPVITPVWTGPESRQPGGRLTLAVLADLISEARQQLLLVSYATFPSAEIRAALDHLAERGVQITMLLERSADNPQFHGNDDPFPGLAAERLYWPAHARPPGAAMHAKVLIVDDTTALVGSANLTGFGLERNLECGLLIRGGPLPATLRHHLLSLEGLVS